MTVNDMGGGISSLAVVRAAESMFRALGGDEIAMIFPLVQFPDDTSVQLGLVDPGVEEVLFSPVIVRNLATPANGPRRRVEFLIAGSAVAEQLVERNAVSAQALLDGALGVSYGGTLFHIEGVVTEYFAGAAYMYRVTGVE